MRVEVDIDANEEVAAVATTRLRLTLSRFTTAVTRVTVRSVAQGPRRALLTARVLFVGGKSLDLDAEDEVSEAALLHFIDRLGRAVARALFVPGGSHG